MKKYQLQPKAIYVYQYLKSLYFRELLKLSIVKVRFLTEQSPAFFFFLKNKNRFLIKIKYKIFYVDFYCPLAMLYYS